VSKGIKLNLYKNIYAIGDVQGCFAELQALLDLVQFNEKCDQLWFVGDLVNRGPRSLEVLRFIKSLGQGAISVLGNHDLHLLAVATGAQSLYREDTLDAILKASDCDELLAWLQQRPLIHYDDDLKCTLVHAGIPPQWDLLQARSLASEVEQSLRSDAKDFFSKIYGNEPSDWLDDLQDWERLRYITNALTRMRFTSASGKLNLTLKETACSSDPHLFPWFDVAGRKTFDDKILFGHWSALKGITHNANAIALDTGCVWGGTLSAVSVYEGRFYSVKAAVTVE
jgi:bis(5'-nucleosyl)-tetraphosphatase (symmetrical)